MTMGITFDNGPDRSSITPCLQVDPLIQNRTKVLQNYKVQNFGRESFDDSTSIRKIRPTFPQSKFCTIRYYFSSFAIAKYFVKQTRVLNVDWNKLIYSVR